MMLCKSNIEALNVNIVHWYLKKHKGVGAPEGLTT
jgi:hypothetical protein